MAEIVISNQEPIAIQKCSAFRIISIFIISFLEMADALLPFSVSRLQLCNSSFNAR
jgi:hypothetical protein